MEQPLPALEHISNGRWMIEGKIGAGSFGDVYAGVETETGIKVAVKRELAASPMPQLFNESDMYDVLSGSEGIPKVFYFGIEGPYNVMVMERLGPSLKELHKNSTSAKIPLRTVVFIIPQLIRRLQAVHNRGIVFRDVKPDQFCVGRYQEDISDRPTVYLIDFGLSTFYVDPATGEHVKSVKPIRNMLKTGTARYASVNVHKGKIHTRRDDLESLIYVLIELAAGKLPWTGVNARNPLQGWRKIGVQKNDMSIAEITEGLPSEFGTMLEYARELRFSEEPDYEELIRLFVRLFENIILEEKGPLKWS
ncbi:hypothetical protein HK101_010728 [Irineochytrium annulatum]|nr:hypothetical protein HK101_010728 [Irineochytrium annulatum]